MSTLKEDYLKHKQLKEQKLAEDARELFEAHVLILEKLDARTINNISTAMRQMEDIVAPILGKVPALKQAIDGAENELNTLVQGKAGNNPKKTTAMLGRALSLYNGLTEFFATDVDALLNLKVFADAKKQPDEPIGRVAGANLQVIQNAFLQALKVEKTGSWLKKVFASNNLPYVDSKALAQQLTFLTYNELISLTKAKKVPVVATQAQIDNVIAQAAAPATAKTADTQQQGQTGRAATPTGVVKNVIDRALAGLEGQDLKTVIAHLQQELQKLNPPEQEKAPAAPAAAQVAAA